jgi:hypothetical protein
VRLHALRAHPPGPSDVAAPAHAHELVRRGRVVVARAAARLVVLPSLFRLRREGLRCSAFGGRACGAGALSAHGSVRPPGGRRVGPSSGRLARRVADGSVPLPRLSPRLHASFYAPLRPARPDVPLSAHRPGWWRFLDGSTTTPVNRPTIGPIALPFLPGSAWLPGGRRDAAPDQGGRGRARPRAVDGSGLRGAGPPRGACDEGRTGATGGWLVGASGTGHPHTQRHDGHPDTTTPSAAGTPR